MSMGTSYLLLLEHHKDSKLAEFEMKYADLPQQK